METWSCHVYAKLPTKQLDSPKKHPNMRERDLVEQLTNLVKNDIPVNDVVTH